MAHCFGTSENSGREPLPLAAATCSTPSWLYKMLARYRRQGDAGVVARSLDQRSYRCLLRNVAEVDVVSTVHEDRH